MPTNEIAVHSRLDPESCWKRISAAQDDSPKIVGYALSSVMDVFADGDSFELRHKSQPIVFRGSVSPDADGSMISGTLAVPAGRFYACALIFTITIGVLLLATSAYDLLFGTHRLLARHMGEPDPGHPANLQEHIAVFVTVPILVGIIGMFLVPKIGRVTDETRQTTRDFLAAMFPAQHSSADSRRSSDT